MVFLSQFIASLAPKMETLMSKNARVENSQKILVHVDSTQQQSPWLLIVCIYSN